MIHTSILSCFSNPEVQDKFKPIVQDVGVKVDLLQYLECAPSIANVCVQCDNEYLLFESTPRIDSYSTSEFPDAAQGTDILTGTYHPSDIQSSLIVRMCMCVFSDSLIILYYNYC